MSTLQLLQINLFSPVVLAFALGVVARLVRSELRLPSALYQSLAIYLLLALGLKGGHELSSAGWGPIAKPAVATLILGCITPLSAYFALRRLGKFPVADAAGIAAHYGSVSAVTFIAAQQFVSAVGGSSESFMPTLLALLESPGIHVALALGVLAAVRQPVQEPAQRLVASALAGGGSIEYLPELEEPEPKPARPVWNALHEVLTGRTMILLAGGLVVGCLAGEAGWKQVQPFFDSGFKGALMLFLLEMGMLAAERFGDLKRTGLFLLAFGVVTPLVHGLLGVTAGHLGGLSPGGATVLGAMAGSASYIAAPPAVRATLPEANPTYSLTLALGITFPFNVVVGIPLLWRFASLMGGQG